ncbi:MAG: SH3 domain-containing protein [Ruminococcus sp.]|nr:SH3 domain-containing protein [Ruminococcus sp.]
MKKMVSYLAAFSMVLSMIPASVSANSAEAVGLNAYDAASAVTADAAQSSTVDVKELAGRWRLEEAKDKYTVDLCAEYMGVIDVKEDGTFVYSDTNGTATSGKITVSEEEYIDGTRLPLVSFKAGTKEIFGGYFHKMNADVITGGNGDMSRIVKDTAWDDGTEQLAIERMNNYARIDGILAGALPSDDKAAFKEGVYEYRKVTDEKFKTLDDIKAFINANTTGDLSKQLVEISETIYMEKDGVLYVHDGGRGSIDVDTKQGVIVTDKTDKSFTATTVQINPITGQGHSRAVFTAEGDDWKISSFDCDFYSLNRSAEDYKLCAESRISALNYLLKDIEASAAGDAKDKIKVNGVEFVKAQDQNTTPDILKKTAKSCTTGALRDGIIKDIEARIIEKDGVVYRSTEMGQAHPDFILDSGAKIISMNPDGFKASTVDASDKDGYGIFEFENDGDKFLIKSYTLSAFDQERLFGGYVDVESGDLNLRKEPNTTSKIITVIPKGTQLDIYESGTAGWYKVLYDGFVGYVSTDYIKKIPDSDIPAATTTVAPATTAAPATTTAAAPVTSTAAPATTAPAATTANPAPAVDAKELAGRWRFEEAKDKYSVDLCAEYMGVIDVKEDGTFVYTDSKGTETSGKITVSEEEYIDGTRLPLVLFKSGAIDVFGGYYHKMNADVITGGNGDMSRIVKDTAWDDGTEQLAIEKMNNYTKIDNILAGALASSNTDSIKEGDYTYFKVIDKNYKSLSDIKAFINANTTGDLNKQFIDRCGDIFVEKDGVLYERDLGRGSIDVDTKQGVIITDKTDKSFTATTVQINPLTGQGHSRAVFTADGDDWKISSFESDFYSVNRSSEDYKLCAESRITALNYLLKDIESAATGDSKDRIKVNGVEFVNVQNQSTSPDILKEVAKNCTTGALRESIIKDIEARIIEKDGVVYRSTEMGQAHPDFILDSGAKVISMNPDGFKASTVDASDKDGYGIFEFENDGDKFLISSYTLSAFDEERLFGGYVAVESGDLNLRKEPNTTSKIIAGIPKGTQLDIYESGTAGWYKVLYDGFVGYVSTDYIKKIPDSDIPVTTTAAPVTTTAAPATTTTAAPATTTAAAPVTSTAAPATSTAAPATTAPVPVTTEPAGKTLPENIGDVNGDKVVDSSDASEVLLIYANVSTGGGDVTEAQKAAADINGDGLVDSADASLILEYYAYVSTGGTDKADVYFNKK